MPAGKYRNIVEIQEPIIVGQDDYGNVEMSYEPFAIVPANIVTLRGEELVIARQLNAKVSYRIEIRYIRNIHSHMRIVHNESVYEITEALPIGRGAKAEWHLYSFVNPDVKGLIYAIIYSSIVGARMLANNAGKYLTWK